MASNPLLPLNPDDLARRLAASGLSLQCSVIAVSGGPDSMALLWLAAQLAEGKPDIHAVTVDHGLRPEAAGEAAQVAAFAHKLGIAHTTLERPAPSEKTRILETARRDRYRLLEKFCRDKGMKDLYTAHHQDDQAETVLFRLAKGSGLDGLVGMRPVSLRPSGIRLCRPLLNVPKAALVATCCAHGIPFVEDRSNDDPSYARPRMRGTRDALAAEGLTSARLDYTAYRLNRAREAIEFYVEQAEKACTVSTQTDRIVLCYEAWRKQPAEIRLRLLQRTCIALRLDGKGDDDYGVGLRQLESIADDLTLGNRRRATLGGCLFIPDPKGDTLTIARETKPD